MPGRSTRRLNMTKEALLRLWVSCLSSPIVVACGNLMQRYRRQRRATILQIPEEDALAQEYERLRPDHINRVDGRNGPSEDTERGEEDCLSLSIFGQI